MRFLLLALLSLTAFGADMPPDAAQAVASYDKACADIQAKADAAKSDAAMRLVPILDASMKRATQAGNLDAAMAVKAKREEVLGRVMSSLAAAFNPAGVWQASDGRFSVTINVDGTWKSSAATFFGVWSLTGEGLVLISTGSNAQRVVVPAAKRGQWSLNNGKTIYEMTLVKPAR
jgi:hypothetical protein